MPSSIHPLPLPLLFFFAASSVVSAYPPLPPPFAYPSVQHQQMAMAAGMEPIMPINYPIGGFSSFPAVRHSSSPTPFGFGSDPLGTSFAAQQHTPMGSPLIIRNSPYQAPPVRNHFAMNHLYGGSLQQPIFPQGMAVGKSGLGVHPSAAVLPSDIPMDVLVGKQMIQHGLDEMSQSMSSSGGRHPFPLSPFFASDGTSSFGGAFGTDSQKGNSGQQSMEQNVLQEFEQLQPERMAPTTKPFSPTLPMTEGTTPLLPALVPHSAVISAETSSDPNSSSLPVFLQGASQEHIDEFKRIIRQPNGTYADQVRQIDALVQRMDPERQMMYREFMRENDERERLHRDRVHKTVAEMSDKAQEQFAKISANLRNPNVPDQERWERVLQLYGKMEPELRNEFEQKFKGFPMFSPAMV